MITGPFGAEHPSESTLLRTNNIVNTPTRQDRPRDSLDSFQILFRFFSICSFILVLLSFEALASNSIHNFQKLSQIAEITDLAPGLDERPLVV